MSCNGCRVLRKGCNENCILRQSLMGIENPQAQANATVFVAKFFGRAGLMSFLSSVPESQRPALFQSLLFEACGRTVNPVNGAVGLIWTGNWNLCQSAVETVLRGEVLGAPPDFSGGSFTPESDNVSETNDLHLGLTARMTAGGRVRRRTEKRRPATPSRNSEESETTTLESYHQSQQAEPENKILRLFF